MHLSDFCFNQVVISCLCGFLQVRAFYTEVLNEEERQRLCQNMAGALKAAQVFIQKRMVSINCVILAPFLFFLFFSFFQHIYTILPVSFFLYFLVKFQLNLSPGNPILRKQCLFYHSFIHFQSSDYVAHFSQSLSAKTFFFGHFNHFFLCDYILTK